MTDFAWAMVAVMVSVICATACDIVHELRKPDETEFEDE